MSKIHEKMAIFCHYLAMNGSKRSFVLIFSARDDLVKVSWKSDAGKCRNQQTPPYLDGLSERYQSLWWYPIWKLAFRKHIFDSSSIWGSPFLTTFFMFLTLPTSATTFQTFQNPSILKWNFSILFSKRPFCSFAPCAHPNCQPFCMNSVTSLCLSWPNIPGKLFQYSGPWKFYPWEAIKRSYEKFVKIKIEWS